MGIARSTVYGPPPVETDDTALVEAISAITGEFEAYGWRRVRAALRQQGIVANHKKIRRLMREHDLQPRMRRRHVVTTDSAHDGPIFPNLAPTSNQGNRTSSDSSTSPTSRSGAASPTWLSSLTPGPGASSATRSGAPLMSASPLVPCAPPSHADVHHPGAFTMAIAARSTLQGITANCSPRLVSSARWVAAATPTTTHAPRAS